MKNRVMQNSLCWLKTSLLSLSFFSFLLISLLPQQLIAQNDASLVHSGAIIKYLGFVEDKLLFHVNIDNQKSERCSITIEDENGNALYQQDFKAEKFIKTFSIDKEALEGENLIFVLNRGRVKEEQVFKVSTNVRLVQEVVVAKQ